MPSAEPTQWWTLREASEHTGLGEETIRRWARQAPPRVRCTETSVGQKRRVLVSADDVQAQAALPGPRRRSAATRPAAPPATVPTGQGVLLDRVAVLEEVVRLRRVIDEERDEIEALHRNIEARMAVIAGHQRAIEVLLSGPSFVTDS